MDKKKIVVVESPYGNESELEVIANIVFARFCMKYAIHQDVVPFASHLLYTQPGILDDDVPGERELGINAGLTLMGIADETWVFIDRGISKGMEYGIANAEKSGRLVKKIRLMEHVADYDDGTGKLIIHPDEYLLLSFMLVHEDPKYALNRFGTCHYRRGW